ncbi:MAG: hypothetical protein ACK5T7_03615, partial [Gemmatimonas sp.]
PDGTAVDPAGAVAARPCAAALIRSKHRLSQHPANHLDHPSAYDRGMDLTWWLGEKIDWASRRREAYMLPNADRSAA